MFLYCSSGCGKSAVYVTLNILMDITPNEKQIDVLGVIAGLRKYRAHMVQNAVSISALICCTLKIQVIICCILE